MLLIKFQLPHYKDTCLPQGITSSIPVNSPRTSSSALVQLTALSIMELNLAFIFVAIFDALCCRNELIGKSVTNFVLGKDNAKVSRLTTGPSCFAAC